MINFQACGARKQPGNQLNYLSCIATEDINSREGTWIFQNHTFKNAETKSRTSSDSSFRAH